MTKRLVLTSPNAELRKVSKEIPLAEMTSPETKTLIQDLAETMKLENGIGIAAPQVNVHKRIIIVDVGQNQPKAFFNPKIVSRSFLKVDGEAGCLSVPGVFGIVKRNRAVTVEAYDQNGQPIRFRAEGLMSVVFQHEIDHLDGILFIDKVIRYTAHPTL